MAKRQWINCPVDDVYDRTAGKFDYGTGKVVEARRIMSTGAICLLSVPELRPLVLTEDVLGQVEPTFDTKALIAKVNREDSGARPPRTWASPRRYSATKSRGKETFFDGKVFDPENPAAYLKSLSIKRVEV